jgi:hypothetical protein
MEQFLYRGEHFFDFNIPGVGTRRDDIILERSRAVWLSVFRDEQNANFTPYCSYLRFLSANKARWWGEGRGLPTIERGNILNSIAEARMRLTNATTWGGLNDPEVAQNIPQYLNSPITNVWAGNNITYANAWDAAISCYVNNFSSGVGFHRQYSSLWLRPRANAHVQWRCRALLRAMYAIPELEQRNVAAARMINVAQQEYLMQLSTFYSTTKSIAHAALYGSGLGNKKYSILEIAGDVQGQKRVPVYSPQGFIVHGEDDDLTFLNLGFIREFDFPAQNDYVDVEQNREILRIGARRGEQEVLVFGAAPSPRNQVVLQVPDLREWDQNVHRDYFGLSDRDTFNHVKGCALQNDCSSLIKITTNHRVATFLGVPLPVRWAG